MRTHNLLRRCTALLLALSLLLSLAACGGKNEAVATTMHLARTEGQVGVSDDAGKDVALLENLGLYSGYGVDTAHESFAWINLDDVKLTKMDQRSEIAIRKEGKKLEIEVKSGSLFFNITEPLADDETMNIRTSSMAVGIRGTCGWVEAPDGAHMNLYLLEGSVECSTGAQTSWVNAGEMAAMTENGQIEVQPFSVQDVPAFVLAEIEDDGDLAETILNASGLDVLHPEEPEEPEELADPVALALEQYRTVVSQADTYDYGSTGTATGYAYALVQLQPEDAVPTLLLEQDTSEYLMFARVFQYDPESETMYQPSESLMEGMAAIGGFRGGLTMMGDGNGIRVTEIYSGSGDMTVYRATLRGDSLVTETVWEGTFDQTMPDNLSSFVQIDWHDVSDLSALDSWTPGAGAPTSQPETAQPAEPDAAETALPTDGDRIVFRGTLNSYSYDDVVTLQGEPDPNAGWSDTSQIFWLILPAPPQAMNLRTGDGLGYREGTVNMINVSYAQGLEDLKQYAGQPLIFSIDPDTTWWPSDTSLPLGQPSADGEIHVLQ